jgi:hypothetical protein
MQQHHAERFQWIRSFAMQRKIMLSCCGVILACLIAASWTDNSWELTSPDKAPADVAVAAVALYEAIVEGSAENVLATLDRHPALSGILLRPQRAGARPVYWPDAP